MDFKPGWMEASFDRCCLYRKGAEKLALQLRRTHFK
jgi:hypothetical protein